MEKCEDSGTRRVSGFEARVRTPEEATERVRELNAFAETLLEFDLDTDDFREVLEHAHETWLLLNPLSETGDEEEMQNVVRFRAWREMNPNFVETDWAHSVKMVRGLSKIHQNFPEVTAQINIPRTIKMTMWHDSGEFLSGDVDAIRQSDEQVVAQKKRDEERAFELIGEKSKFGREALEIISEYEARETLESKMVKLLDCLSGDHSFYHGIIRYIAEFDDVLEMFGNAETMIGALTKMEQNYRLNRPKTMGAALTVIDEVGGYGAFSQCILGQDGQAVNLPDMLKHIWNERASGEEPLVKTPILDLFLRANHYDVMDLFG